MDFKYIKNIADGIGEIRIYEQIGVSYRNGKEIGVSGSVFANEMAHLKSVCNKINIRINSEGGSVLDGYAIFSSILNSEIETESFIDGVAASTAGWCALAANSCNIADYGSLMVHGASGPEDAELIALANGSIAKMLSNRTGMTEDEAKKLMSKETWYKAFDKKDRDTLINKKFVDAVLTTGKKVKVAKNQSASSLAQVYNKLLNPTNMSKINTLLKLRNDAEEAEQEHAIAALNKELADKGQEVESLKNRLKDLEATQKEKEEAAKKDLTNRATALAAQAKKDGKITTDEEVSAMILNASRDEASFQFVSNMLGKSSNSRQAAHAFDFKAVKNGGGTEDRSAWKFSDWSKKDDKGLLKMKNENPEAFQLLYDAEYKK